MLTPALLALSLAAPAAHAKAKAPANPDVSQGVTVRPMRLIWPAVDARYERKVGAQGGAFGEVVAGRYNPLLLRLGTALLDEGTDGEVDIKAYMFGLGAGYNHYFNDYSRGWYLGGKARFDRISVQVASEGIDGAGVTNALTVAPHLGWKVVGASGFTFSVEAGAGYLAALGGNVEVAGESERTTPESGLTFTGGVNMGWSF